MDSQVKQVKQWWQVYPSSFVLDGVMECCAGGLSLPDGERVPVSSYMMHSERRKFTSSHLQQEARDLAPAASPCLTSALFQFASSQTNGEYHTTTTW
jgi:hypothetical protein